MKIILFNTGFYLCLSAAAVLLPYALVNLIRAGRPERTGDGRRKKAAGRKNAGFRITEHVMKVHTDEFI